MKKFILFLLAAAIFLIPLGTWAKQVPPPGWKGMVSFNFDDGYKNVYDNALPIFKKYGVAGCNFPVVSYLEYQAPWAVSWPQLLEFQQAGWEIGSHTMTHPHLTTLTDAQIDYELGESQKILANHGIKAKTLVFPYNDFDARVLDYTTRYYENSRGNEGVNGFNCNRYGIVSRELTNTTKPAEAIAWINEAVQKKMWLVLMLHEVVTGPPAKYQYNAADLENIVAYLAAHGIPVKTIQQALARRQACLGPNLIKNPNLEALDPSGWALNWNRNHAGQVLVEPATVARVFSSGNRLKIVGSSQKNVGSTAIIKLPNNKKHYFFSLFAEASNASAKDAAEIYLDEFDGNGNWLSGQWLGGFYSNTFGMPGYLYQPSSPLVDRIMIDIYSLPGAKIIFWGSNFYFGVTGSRESLGSILELLLGK
jgi:peptidoglycan/xylan/chitin deacetylase (PgdA/CDA1 family)